MPIWILIVILSLIWGYTWVIMKVALNFMGPFTFAFYRFLIGGLAVLLYLFYKRTPLPSKADLPWILLVGLLQTTAMFGFVMYGMQFVGAGETSIIVYTMPIWVVVFGHFLLRERLNLRKSVGVLSGVLGLVIIVGWETLKVDNLIGILGYGFLMAGSLAWGLSNVLIAYRFKKADKVMISGYQMLFGTIGLLPFMVLLEADTPIILNGLSLFSLLFSAIAASSIAIPLWYYILTKIEASTASISILLVPLFGVIFSWIQLGESLRWNLAIGGLSILIGIYLVAVKRENDFIKKGEKEVVQIDLDR